MKTINARKVRKIWGTGNAWNLEPGPDRSEPVTECEVLLEIEGDDKTGYHLVISPEGFFTADYWYASRKEAMQSATKLFGVAESEWS